MPRSVVFALYAGLVVIWSSTWVAIKIGLEDLPPLLSAGIRFVLAGVVLLAVARLLGRPLRTDARLAGLLALLPFAGAYGLIYWGEQYVRSMLGGGLLLLAASVGAEAWEVTWSGRAVGSIAYLALVGSAVPFVTLTLLLRELPAVTVSYITLLLPFGALAFGAALYDERVTLPAVAGAALVAGGLLVARWPLRLAARPAR